MSDLSVMSCQDSFAVLELLRLWELVVMVEVVVWWAVMMLAVEAVPVASGQAQMKSGFYMARNTDIGRFCRDGDGREAYIVKVPAGIAANAPMGVGFVRARDRRVRRRHEHTDHVTLG